MLLQLIYHLLLFVAFGMVRNTEKYDKSTLRIFSMSISLKTGNSFISHIMCVTIKDKTNMCVCLCMYICVSWHVLRLSLSWTKT